MPQLEVRYTSGEVDHRELSKNQPLSIGSHTSNDVCIDEDGVASLHCRISWKKRGFEVVAAGAQGVDVNGTTVSHSAFSAGDILRVGPADIQIVAEKSQKKVAQPKQPESSSFDLKPLSDAENLDYLKETSPAPEEKRADPKVNKPEKDGKRKSSSSNKKSKRKSPAPDPLADAFADVLDEDDFVDDDGPAEDEVVAGTPMLSRSTTYSGEISEQSDEKKPTKEEKQREKQEIKEAAAEEKKSKREKISISQKMASRFGDSPKRPGEQDVIRSPLVITLLVGSVVLALVAFTFWFVIGRDVAQRHYDAAMVEFESGKYTQAIALLENYLAEFSGHKMNDEAKISLSKAKVDKEIGGSSPEWTRGLQAVDAYVKFHRDDEDFSDQHATLRAYAESIALGAAEAAGKNTDRSLLETSNSATTILTRYSPTEEQPVELLEKIKQTYRTAEASILKQETLDEALANIDKQLKAKQPLAALKTRRNLLIRYSELSSNRKLIAGLQKTLNAEKELVIRKELNQAASTEEATPQLAQAVSLTLHTRSSTEDISEGRSVYAVAKDCCYAIDTVTGDPVWRRVIGLDTPFFPVKVSTSVEGLLVFDTRMNDLLLISQKSGDLVWRQNLGARVSGKPLVFEGQIYQSTEDGKLYRIDLESGRINTSLSFPQQVLAPPALVSDGKFLIFAGHESVLYTLSRSPLACQAVSHFGHAAGTIKTPLLSMASLLLISENDRTNSSQLHVVDASQADKSLPHLASQRVIGQVRDLPILRGTQLFVPSNGERVTAFSVSDEKDQPTLTLVASQQPEGGKAERTFLSAGPDGQLWMAGSALRKFQLTTENLRLEPASIAVGASTQPPQLIGSNFFLGRHLSYNTAVVFTQANREEMTSEWKTVLGSSLLDILPSKQGTVIAVNDSGDVFRLTSTELKSAKFKLNRSIELKMPEGLATPLKSTRLSDGRLAVYCGGDEPTLWIVNSIGQLEKKLKLEAPLDAAPVLLGKGIALPYPGKISLISISTTRAIAEDLLVKQGKEVTRRWKQLSAIDETQLIARDQNGVISRIQLRTQPVSHLNEVAKLSLESPVDVPFAIVNQKIVIADSSKKLHAVDAASLDLQSSQELAAPATNAIWSTGNHVFVEVGRSKLQCFNLAEGLKPMWELPLNNVPLAGAPTLIQESLIVALQNGDVRVLNLADGAEIKKVALGQPLTQGISFIGDQLVAISIDGSILKLGSILDSKQ